MSSNYLDFLVANTVLFVSNKFAVTIALNHLSIQFIDCIHYLHITLILHITWCLVLICA